MGNVFHAVTAHKPFKATKLVNKEPGRFNPTFLYFDLDIGISLYAGRFLKENFFAHLILDPSLIK